MLKEYNSNQDRLAYLLPYAYPYNNTSIIINKDSSIQQTFKFRGNDLDSCTKDELVVINNRINNSLKRLSDNNWTFFIEARRKKIKTYFKSENISNIPLFILEKERKEFFKSGNHYESEYYFTLVYKLPNEKQKKFFNIFVTDYEKETKTINIFNEHLTYFKKELDSLFSLLGSIMKEIKYLNLQETITYLHSCISDSDFVVQVPDDCVSLDNYISDTDLVAGLEPKLGNLFLSTVSIYNFPNKSIPCILDKLNRLNIEYRWVTRFICIDKINALKELDSMHRKWFAGQSNIKQLIKEMIFNEKSSNINLNALNKANSILLEKEKLQSDSVALGYYTAVIVLSDENKNILKSKTEKIKNILNSLEFTCEIESYNCVDAWLSTVIGNRVCNIRRPILNTSILANMLPTSAVWAGDKYNDFLSHYYSEKLQEDCKCPPLLQTQTTGNTPFRLNLHYGDVGHSLIVGPTGSGKSVLLTTMACAWTKYPNSQIFTFDKGGSSRVLTKAIGGTFYDLGSDELSFQPLRNCDIDNEWCQEWIQEILEINEGLSLTPQQKIAITNSLKDLSTMPLEQRTLSLFSTYLSGQDKELGNALYPYSHGIYAKYFNGNMDKIDLNNFQVFEMEKIANSKHAITAVLNLLFHKIETERLNGNPTLILLDECWLFFDNPQFEQKIREWLKVLRKKNASVVFATQELKDIANSNILPAVLGACYTRFFLPDINALKNKEVYSLFGLNEQEIYIIQNAIAKRQYYFKNPKGCRLFELSLSDLELAYIGTSSEENQKKCKELNNLDTISFNIEWLKYKGFEGKNIIDNITLGG